MASMEAATEKLTVTLPDGKPLELPAGATGADAAAAIGPGLAKAALAIRVDGELRDLAAPLPDGAPRSAILTDRDPEALELIRHDAAHVMAEAVLELYPGTKVTIGPPIESGFYYDFEFPADTKITEEDLAKIEAAMREHIDADEEFGRRDVPVAEAIEIFKGQGQDYKVELIEDLVRDEGVETVSLYRNGPFEDLCRGPHGPSTGRIKAIKLSSVAGAYWRGDENRERLTRIYGTAFFSKKDLEQHLERIEQAKARDHRRLGPQLGLFMLREEAPGMPFWLPNGTDAAAPDRGRGPGAAAQARLPGDRHPAGARRGALAPLRALGQLPRRDVLHGGRRAPLRAAADELPRRLPRLLGSDRHSYRELPLRLAEFGRVSRNEREGVLHGLLRVRAFTQDDAHVYCTEEQITDEVAEHLRGDRRALRALRLRGRPGRALDPAGEVDGHRRAVGEGRGGADRGARAPGPRVRAQPRRRRLLRAEDRLPRHRRARPLLAVRHLPARLPDARALRPLLHGRRRRAAPAGDDPPRPARLDGALRRDPDRALRRPLPGLAGAGAGDRPADLRPPQRLRRSGRSSELRELGVRVAVDDRSESVGKKIRDAEIGRYPYMLVVGDREQETGAVAVRSHDDGELGEMSLAEFADRVKSETGTA